ncbi:hypothetical protein [Halopiger djelfimassiliensis]|uniref:hypothetical protein n=1 Tax=Halopiger djelfimassiliensis TaxID=1293047 RepID=UPI0012B58A11|nr:hypothetical protein [Halopiger djelfimassiliensis]
MDCIDDIVCVSGISLTVPRAILLLFIGVILSFAYRLYQDRTIIMEGGEEFSVTTWWQWRQWSLRRMYRQFKSDLLIGRVSSHTFLIKSLIAFGLVAALVISMRRVSSPSSPPGLDQQILVAATAFYATMIYFDGRFQFAALRHRDRGVTISSSSVDMDMLQVSMELYNDGALTAESIEAKMTVVDPVRERSTWSHNAEISGLNESEENATDPLKSGYSREIAFSFIPSQSEIERIRMEDEYGVDPWAEIKITSPEQMTATWIYVPLRNEETIDMNQVANAAKLMAQTVQKERKRVLGEDSQDISDSMGGSDNDDDEDSYIPPSEIF